VVIIIYYVHDGVPEENKVEKRCNKNMFELAEDHAEWRAVRFGVMLKYCWLFQECTNFQKKKNRAHFNILGARKRTPKY
jgi:hypothetical protein